MLVQRIGNLLHESVVGLVAGKDGRSVSMDDGRIEGDVDDVGLSILEEIPSSDMDLGQQLVEGDHLGCLSGSGGNGAIGGDDVCGLRISVQQAIDVVAGDMSILR